MSEWSIYSPTLPNYAALAPVVTPINTVKPNQFQGGGMKGSVSGTSGFGSVPGVAPAMYTAPAPTANLQGSLAVPAQGTYNTYTPAFGGKPAVPNPADSAADAVIGNIANYPNISALTGEVNAQNLASVLANVNANLPNYTDLIGKRSGNISDLLSGAVPQDVQDQMTQAAATLGIQTGMPGAQAIDFSNLKNLGLTSLGMKKEGASELGSALQTMPQVPIMDPTQMMVSPSDMQSAQYASNVIAASPDPTTAAETAFQRSLQIRALDEQIANAEANADFQRKMQLEQMKAALNRGQQQPTGTKTPSVSNPNNYGYNPSKPGQAGPSSPVNYGYDSSIYNPANQGILDNTTPGYEETLNPADVNDWRNYDWGYNPSGYWSPGYDYYANQTPAEPVNNYYDPGTQDLSYQDLNNYYTGNYDPGYYDLLNYYMGY